MDRGRVITEGSPRALIAQHIEPHVLEVHGPATELDGARAHACAALERVGDTVYCYGEDIEPVLRSVSGELSYLHRAASLEDVFLKLTGRICGTEACAGSRSGVATSWCGASVAAGCASNLADPLIMLFGLGYGSARCRLRWRERPYASCRRPAFAPRRCSPRRSNSMFGSAHAGQKTWDAILYAPLIIDDIVEIVWAAASKAWLTGSTILGVAAVFGLATSPWVLPALPAAFLVGLAFSGLGLVMRVLARAGTSSAIT